MGRKAKYSKELKLEIVKRYLRGESSILLAKEYNMTYSMSVEIIRWVHKYEAFREKAFEESNKNKSYSKEFKNKVIQAYFNCEDSYEGLAIKYSIPSSTIVKNWVKKYNNGVEIKNYDPKGDVYTMKSRKVTREEKLEIIQYVLANNNDYKGAADRYTIPYYDVYNWVKKYIENGEESLKDNRGRPSKNKPEVDLSEEDKLKIELEKQKRINDRLALEIEILKKNIEIKKRLEKDFRK